MSAVGEAQRAENALGGTDWFVDTRAIDVLPVVRRQVRRRQLDYLVDRLTDAAQFFPDLAGQTVTVGLLDEHHLSSRDPPIAAAGPRNYLIYVPHDELVHNQTLFHELAHLEIYHRDRAGEDLPTSSEPFCSIYAVARMTPDRVFRDDIAYVGEPSAPKDDWPAICRRALAYRDERGGGSHYVKRAKEWLGIDG